MFVELQLDHSVRRHWLPLFRWHDVGTQIPGDTALLFVLQSLSSQEKENTEVKKTSNEATAIV